MSLLPLASTTFRLRARTICLLIFIYREWRPDSRSIVAIPTRVNTGAINYPSLFTNSAYLSISSHFDTLIITTQNDMGTDYFFPASSTFSSTIAGLLLSINSYALCQLNSLSASVGMYLANLAKSA